MKKNKTKDEKLEKSIAALEHALSFKKKAQDDEFYFSGIAKSFEICLEYAWKHLKKEVDEHGIEVFSPKDTIKAAGRIGLIDDVEIWLDFLVDRNLAVHDYLGISNDEYLKTIEKFLDEVKKLL